MNDPIAQGQPAAIQLGSPVFDTNGAKIGTLKEYQEDDSYFVVEKGLFFHTDVFIPTSAITTATMEGIAVQMSKDELADDRYSLPPVPMRGNVAAADERAVSAAPAGTFDQVGDIRVPVREEELVVGKERQQEGAVHIHKDVITEQQTVNVPLQHERVTVERVPVTGDAARDDAFVARDIDVPLMGETAVVGKRVTGVEDVLIHKDVVTEEQDVSDTVRKERVLVDGVDSTSETSAKNGRQY